VSIQDERALRDRLTSLLDEVEARPAPVGAAIKTGRAIRTRRRLAVAGGLAAIVVAGALVPGLLRHPPAKPLAHGRFQVSVHAPGKHDPANLIAFGTVNGRKWRATATATGPLRRLTVNFSGFPLLGGPLTKPLGATASTGITAFDGVGSGTGDHAEHAMVSEVSTSITLITMRLANGAVLKLHPVTYDGAPVIALVLPQGLRVLEADAYSRNGVVAYAIPFYYRGQNTLYTWLRPSQAPPAVVNAAVPVALDSHRGWTVSVHIGPWGKCVVILDHSGFNQGCGPTSPTRKLADFDMGLGGGPVIGVTSPDVAFFELAMADGSTVRVSTVHIGDTGYYAVASQTNPKVISWIAYDQGGHRLGSGPGIPGTPPSAGH
jgi:hypothetical protein